MYQRWFIRQWLLISAPCLCLVPSLIFSPIKQSIQKYVIPECIGMEILFSHQVFTRNWNIRNGAINFASQRNFNALVYLAKPVHKKTFVWGHPLSTYVSYYRFSNPLPLYVPVHILDDPPPFPLLRTYLMDGLFLNQKRNKNIRISYSLKYKHSKIIFFCKKVNGTVVWNKHWGEQY